jgi:hypothetical protein
MLKD